MDAQTIEVKKYPAAYACGYHQDPFIEHLLDLYSEIKSTREEGSDER